MSPAYNAAYYAAHQKEILARAAVYRASHQDEKRAYNAAYRAANREKLRAYQDTYRAARREELQIKGVAYEITHREERRAYAAAHREERRAYAAAHREERRAHYAAHREEKRAYAIAYRAAHREKLRAYNTAYRAAHREEFRLREAAYQKERLATDPQFRLICNLRSRVSIALKKNQKAGHTLELIGCTVPEWRAHLERQFQPGMTWENYGPVWEIDHVRPCASFDLSDPDQQRACFNWSNTQPLFAEENLKKGAKFTPPEP